MVTAFGRSRKDNSGGGRTTTMVILKLGRSEAKEGDERTPAEAGGCLPAHPSSGRNGGSKSREALFRKEPPGLHFIVSIDLVGRNVAP